MNAGHDDKPSASTMGLSKTVHISLGIGRRRDD